MTAESYHYIKNESNFQGRRGRIGRMTKKGIKNPSKNAKKYVSGEWMVDKMPFLVLNLI